MIVIPILVIILGGVGGVYYYINHTIYKPTKIEDIFSTKDDEAKSQFNEEQGEFNFLLCGLDGRKSDTDSRTDSMILASIDTNKKSVKLVSFMRDLYVPIPGHGQTRLNTSFALGGPELLMKTINQDFNLNIQYYITIDFKAFQSLVDAVGGVDVDIKDYELQQLNYYIKEANWNNPDFIKSPGYQHINGQQALSYCRIRKVGNNDYERTERQRKVLSLLIAKAKKMSVFKLPQLFATLLPYVKTNVPTTKLANLGFTVFRFGSTTIDSARIPADNMFKGMKINGADVLVADMDKNVEYLDSFLTGKGSIGASNVPEYMANNFHMNDKPIDKRGTARKTVKIILPRNAADTKALDQVPEASNGDVSSFSSDSVLNTDVINPDDGHNIDTTNSSSNTEDGKNKDIRNSGQTRTNTTAGAVNH